MSSDFKLDISAIISSIQSMDSKAGAAIMKYAEAGASKVEAYAKSNARWQNRTGDARRRLKGDVLSSGSKYRIRLAHGVDYGKWLELANERRYAIIEESINAEGPGIIKGFDKLVERLG